MFWTKNGRLILINCDHCPCQQIWPCNDWYLQENGSPITYNVSISFQMQSIEKWRQVYGENEAEEYYNQVLISGSASLSNIPASTLLSNFCFDLSNISAEEQITYRWFDENGLYSINTNTYSLTSSNCGCGCSSEWPDPEIQDENTHGWTFACNQNNGDFFIRLNSCAGSCHGEVEEYTWIRDIGEDTYTYEDIVSIGTMTNHLVFPKINPNLSVQYIENKGYILDSDSLNLSYANGQPEDDNYKFQSYSHIISFDANIPNN